MNDELEQQIAQAFNRQAAQLSVPTVTSMTEGAIRRGHRRSRRRQAGAVAATAAVIAIAVPAVNLALNTDGSPGRSTTPGGTPGTPSVSPTPTLSSSPTPTLSSESPARPATTPCSKVKAPPPDTEVDTVLDTERSFLQFFYTVNGKNYAYSIDFRNDPTCQDDPALRRLIQHALNAGY